MANSILSHDARALDLAAASAWGRKLRTGFSTALRRFQVARMATLLNGLSDTQLRRMGIRRAGIASYAQSLVDSDA